MRAFGSKRTYSKCRVIQAGFGKKILVKLTVKNHKLGRKVDQE